MKKEIKFRAWHKNRKEMYQVHGWHSKYVFKDTLDGVGCDGNPDNIEDVELMQYTGLKDKTGKEIYEGDIVKSKQHNPQNYLIEFIEGGFCATNPVIDVYPIDINHFYSSVGCSIEVIGNIHENKNLLK